jgi:ABC-2 type transport system permease protein
MVLLVGLVAPPLISQDIRSRAFLLYFSRPLTRGEYLLGKLGSVWFFLAMISTIPALVLYFMGVVLSPSLSVVSATWDLPIRIVGASVVLMLPTSALALCLSSMTQESRYAGFSWFAIWILGWFTYGAAQSAEAFKANQEFEIRNAEANGMRNPQRNRFRGPPGFRGRPTIAIPESAWAHLSLYHTLGKVQSWVFGFAKFRDVRASIAILIGLTTVSLAVLFYRISAPMRV